MEYRADDTRYDRMEYRTCGKSGLRLPALSFGLWHNFGTDASYRKSADLIHGCFDRGITHFDLANNYGPPPGSAETLFGTILKNSLHPYRDEIVISTKAGYHMWEGPYGEWGSRKHLVSSLDQSLKRMGLEYVDIFYHHRPDPDTPIGETVGALASIVRSGKALYIGISNYNDEQTQEILTVLKREGIPCLLHQMECSLLRPESPALLRRLEAEGVGGIAFSPLAQGVLTGKYLDRIPADSRAAGSSVFLTEASLTAQKTTKVAKLAQVAKARGQSLTHMALAWVLAQPSMTSVIVGARNLEQMDDNLQTLANLSFSDDELEEINSIIAN